MFGRCTSWLALSFALLTVVADADAKSWSSKNGVAQGKVSVSSADDIQALRGIIRIRGDLVVMNFTGTDLRGLESLALVEGNVIVFSNPTLSSLKGLENLEQIDGRLSVTSNPALASLGHLKKLHSVIKGVGITDNKVLKVLPPRALRIGEPIKKLKGFLQITGNGSLENATAQAYASSCDTKGQISVRDNG